MKRKWLIAFVFAALIVCGFVSLFPKSTFPIKTDTVSHIVFYIYPQDTPNFTVTDDARVEEIVSAINNLTVAKCDSRPERMGEYYYSLALHCTGGDTISLNLSENAISINNENFNADTHILHTLLEKTYHDIQNWNIE